LVLPTGDKMKILCPLVFLLLLIISCSTSIDLKVDFGRKKSVDYKSLLQRNGAYYEINSEESFSGLVIDKYESGQYRLKGYLRKGKWDGLVTEYYQNGQKKVEKNFNEVGLDGLHIQWYGNGQKKVEGTFKDGKEIGSPKRWDKDGFVK